MKRVEKPWGHEMIWAVTDRYVGKVTGTVLPACKLTVNKKKQQVEIETYQNPWKLSNFMISKD